MPHGKSNKSHLPAPTSSGSLWLLDRKAEPRAWRWDNSGTSYAPISSFTPLHQSKDRLYVTPHNFLDLLLPYSASLNLFKGFPKEHFHNNYNAYKSPSQALYLRNSNEKRLYTLLMIYQNEHFRKKRLKLCLSYTSL